MKNSDNLTNLRLSLGFILNYVIADLFPDTQFGLIVETENGFYADFKTNPNISENDFGKIQAKMLQFIEANTINLSDISREKALKSLSDQPYLSEYLSEEYSDQRIISCSISKYTGVFFVPRDFRLAELKGCSFKLMKIGGAYWLNKAGNDQLQRMHLVVFDSQNKLDSYIETTKQHDHHKLGRQHELFMFSELVGSGLPLWLENGAVIRQQIEQFIMEEETKKGYIHVLTPDIAHQSLYEASGHWPYYKDDMYPPVQMGDDSNDNFLLRPMTCPHHFVLYKRKPRSFRELPIRYAELAKLYRKEKSGELSGLMRVRCFTLSDAHIVCRPDQVNDELNDVLQLIEDMAAVFGLQKGRDYHYRLSLGDRKNKDKYYQNDQAWEEAEQILAQVLRNRGDKYVEAPDEAAFYGPKIDFQRRSLSGKKEETAFTVQYDFVMPERFDLNYADEKNQSVRAVVIHRSLVGAIERFMAFLIEFYGAKFPLWLAPCQIRLLTLSDSPEIVESVRSLQKIFLEAKIRAQIDIGRSSIGKKLKQAEESYIPVTLIVGEKELESQRFKPNIRSDLNISLNSTENYSVSEIVEAMAKDIFLKR